MTSFKVLYGAAVAMVIISKAVSQESGYGHEEYAYPKYEFDYQVKDEHTKDIKSQHETRDGHNVKGFYSLLQPDGRTRIVEYNADEKLGFNAAVKYEGVQQHEYQAPIAVESTGEYRYSGAPIYIAPQPKYESPIYSNTAYSKASVSTPHFSYSY